MVIRNEKNLVGKFHGDREIVRKYHGDRLVWEKQSGELPAGYTRLKYLESNRRQYIRFPDIYETSGNSKVITTVFAKSASDSSSYIFGGNNSSESSFKCSISRLTGYCQFQYGLWGAAGLIFEKNYFNVETHITMDGLNKIAVVNGDVKPLPNRSVDIGPLGSLFCTYKTIYNNYPGESASGPYYPFLGQIKTFDFYPDGINLALSLIPSLDNNQRPCMYDTVSKQPFYNRGTGEFGYELMDGTYVAPI